MDHYNEHHFSQNAPVFPGTASQIKRHLLHTARCHPIYPDICHPTHQDDDEATKMDWMQSVAPTSASFFISVQLSRITTEEAAFLGLNWNLILYPPPTENHTTSYYLSIHHNPSIYLLCIIFLKKKIFPNKKTWNLPNLVQPQSTHRCPSSPERLRPNCLLPLPLSVPRRRHVSNPTGQPANPPTGWMRAGMVKFWCWGKHWRLKV